MYAYVAVYVYVLACIHSLFRHRRLSQVDAEANARTRATELQLEADGLCQVSGLMPGKDTIFLTNLVISSLAAERGARRQEGRAPECDQRHGQPQNRGTRHGGSRPCTHEC